MSKESKNPTPDTTFDTWGRMAEEQMNRFNSWHTQMTQMQLAALDQVRDMIDYSAKLGTEWQKHAMDTSRKLYSQFMPQR